MNSITYFIVAHFFDIIYVCYRKKEERWKIIQRKLKIGYTRANRIIEGMKAKGIISKLQGTKPRKVLISKEYWDMIKDNK